MGIPWQRHVRANRIALLQPPDQAVCCRKTRCHVSNVSQSARTRAGDHHPSGKQAHPDNGISYPHRQTAAKVGRCFYHCSFPKKFNMVGHKRKTASDSFASPVWRVKQRLGFRQNNGLIILIELADEVGRFVHHIDQFIQRIHGGGIFPIRKPCV